MESENVQKLGLQNYVDLNYYRGLVDDAKEAIEKYIPFDEFVSDSKPPFDI